MLQGIIALLLANNIHSLTYTQQHTCIVESTSCCICNKSARLAHVHQTARIPEKLKLLARRAGSLANYKSHKVWSITAIVQTEPSHRTTRILTTIQTSNNVNSNSSIFLPSISSFPSGPSSSSIFSSDANDYANKIKTINEIPIKHNKELRLSSWNCRSLAKNLIEKK